MHSLHQQGGQLLFLDHQIWHAGSEQQPHNQRFDMHKVVVKISFFTTLSRALLMIFLDVSQTPIGLIQDFCQGQLIDK